MKSRRSERARRAALFAALGLFLTSPSPARAEEATEPASAGASPEIVEARRVFREASALARHARWDEASAAFERSYALHAHPVTSYNIAYCERAVGHYTRAQHFFARALREHRAGDRGVLPESLVSSAQSYAREAAERVAKVQVSSRARGARLVVDGRPLQAELVDGRTIWLAGVAEAGPASAPEGSFELWLDPGPHVFVTSIPGAPDSVITRRFEPGSRTTYELVAAPPAHAPRPARARVEPSSGGRGLSYLAFGIGAAGLVVGGVTGALALHKRSELVDACGAERGACPPDRRDDIDAMNRFADVSTIGFVTAAVGAGVGAWLTLTGQHSGETRPPRSARLVLGPLRAHFAAEF